VEISIGPNLTGPGPTKISAVSVKRFCRRILVGSNEYRPLTLLLT
jgi:hypothetical protein